MYVRNELRKILLSAELVVTFVLCSNQLERPFCVITKYLRQVFQYYTKHHTFVNSNLNRKTEQIYESEYPGG